MADENSVLYAFGETWGPENKRDKIFGFQPGAGIHDIHINHGMIPHSELMKVCGKYFLARIYAYNDMTNLMPYLTD